MLFTRLTKLVLKFFLKLLQYVFSQDVPLQSTCSPSLQINDLKHRAGMSLWQIPVVSCDIVAGKDETPLFLHINTAEREERAGDSVLTRLSEGNDCEVSHPCKITPAPKPSRLG